MMLKISWGILTIPECLERLSAQCEGSRSLDFTAPKDTRELHSAAWRSAKDPCIFRYLKSDCREDTGQKPINQINLNACTCSQG